jgi:hypothetical protein
MSRRRRKPAAQRAAQTFWAAAQPVDAVPRIASPDDPTAMVASLGPPPLGVLAGPGEHYLQAAYDKASGVAVALAAAGGLLGLDELEGAPDGADEPR